MLKKANKVKTSIKDTTDREVTLELMHFGQSLPCIIQEIWETDPAKGPTWFSKLDVTDAYHRGNLRPYQVGTFVYVVPSASEDDGVVIFNDMVL